MGFFSDLWHGMILKEETSTKEGYVSAEEQLDLLGKEGIVAKELRPAGTVIIDNNPVDVVSEGEYIPKGEMVKVLAINGSRVVVRRVNK